MERLNEKELMNLQVEYVTVANDKATLLNVIFLQRREPTEAEQKHIDSLTDKENEVWEKVTGWKSKKKN